MISMHLSAYVLFSIVLFSIVLFSFSYRTLSYIKRMQLFNGLI